MPKYSQEMETKIISLFEQGKRNSVISRELSCDRGAIAKLRKEWKKRQQEQEAPETEHKEIIQQKQTLDPQKYTQAPTNHRALLSKITELKKRMNELEENQRGPNPSLDSLLLKRIKKIEEKQQESNPSLLEKRIKKLEKTQRGSNPSLLKRKISELEAAQRVGRSMRNSIESDLGKLKEELTESAERRLKYDDACKEINKNGFCLLYYFTYDDYERFEYLKPGGTGEREGKKIYYVKVKEHPLICSACPDYESKS